MSFIHYAGIVDMQQDAPDLDSERTIWWLFVGVALAIVVFAVYLYLAAFALGLFVYYAARPVERRIRQRGTSPGLAAIITVAVIVIPIILLITYVSIIGFQAVSDLMGGSLGSLGPRANLFSILSNPQRLLAEARNTDDLLGAFQTSAGVLGALAQVVIQLFVALAFVAYLLRDDQKLADWFRSQIGEKDTVAHAYMTAVDSDLELVYFGNVLTILIVTVFSLVVYTGFNLLSPSDLVIPIPVVLAVLTGLTSIVPIVVSKLIYIPITLYLGVLAVRSDAALLIPAMFVIISFVTLDIIPQTVVQPYLAGRESHVGLMLFAYIAGPTVFGWYGLFLGPFLLVVVIQVFRIVFPQMVRGERLTPAVTMGEDIGSDPDTTSATSTGSGEDEPDSASEGR